MNRELMATSDSKTNPDGVVRRVWESWKQAGKRIGDFQARALLSLFYFIVFAPFALVVRWVSDPLAIKPGNPRGWRVRTEGEGTWMERATRQS